jgi:hypothetical protein
MGRKLLFIALSAGCGSGKVGVVGGDTGTVSASDTAAATDSGAVGDSGGDTGTAKEPQEPLPDLSVWQADLTFSYDTWGDSYDCVGDTITESGSAIESGSTYDDMVELCPSCTVFYETSFDTTTVCDWIELPEGDLRGVSFGDTWAAVYRFDETDSGLTMDLMDSNAPFDGWAFEFEYVFSYWVDVDVVGVVTYPEADPE